jgi:hypothetical protein
VCGMTAAVTGCVERDVRRRASGCRWRAKAGARGIAAFWPGVNSSRRAERTSGRRSIDDQATTGPERVGRTSFNPARSSAAVHTHRSLSFRIPVTMGCSLDCPAEPPSFDPGNEKDRLHSLRRGRGAPGGQTTRQQRLELPTIVWSVVPSGLDSPRHGSTSRSGARAPLRRLLLGRLPAGRQRRGGREVLARATARARIAPVSAPVLPSERDVAVA